MSHESITLIRALTKRVKALENRLNGVQSKTEPPYDDFISASLAFEEMGWKLEKLGAGTMYRLCKHSVAVVCNDWDHVLEHLDKRQSEAP